MDTIDPQVKRLVMAIGETETGGHKDPYNARGASGEFGRYQFLPETYKSYAKKYLGDSNAQPTMENQNKIAYSFVKEKKDAGLSPAQIASMWNAGESEPDAYRGTFSTGKPSRGTNDKGVVYDVPSYAMRVSDNFRKFNNPSIPSTLSPTVTPSTESSSNGIPSLTDSVTGSLPVVKQATEFGVGIGTAVGKALLNVPKAGLKFAQGVSNVGSKIMGSEPADYSGSINAIDTLSKDLFQKPYEKELSTGFGKAGNVVGTVAPYVTTGGVTSELSNMASGSKLLEGTGLLKTAGRIAAGATGEAAANFGTGYVLSGGDTKEAKNQALISGALKAGFSTIGEIVNATKLPESLVGKIFRTNYAKMKTILGGNKDDTLAKQVLDRGHYGNTEDLAQQFVSGMDEAETKLSQKFAEAGNPSIYLEEPERYINYLKDKADLLKKSGATKEAQGLESSIPAINPETGEISANNALGLRRFLDGLRNEKSYLNPTEELNAQQAGLKEMTDEVRHKINAIAGIGDVMKDYSFYIKAMDSLARHAVRTANSKGLGIINSFLLGEGIASANPVIAGLGVARKVLGTTKGATVGANVLKNLPKSSKVGSGVRSAVSSGIAKVL